MTTPAEPKPITLEIDGTSVQVPAGATVMDAATKLGIFVPHFCYHKKLSIAANCRMCLVQVEKAPKPLPACATPATEGMKAFTHSTPAVNAQKGVMEFLLINHPLDCPICDQGGECQLQDLAVGYGASASRYQEDKRVVVNKNLGPLISTDMTRCIHCTRCVRFGQEIAGVMELGMAGRGEHSEILSFVGRTVDSELSGNMIDLCPVGALTSKPFRYTARAWELARRRSVSPHDSLGSGLVVQAKQERVMRVLPLENDDVNECWISDRDRFAYEGINSEERLLYPMVRRAGEWAEVDWPEALEAAAQGLKEAVSRHGADALGMLLAPHLTLEELHLAAGLGRALGTDNIDHRIHQADFRAGTQGAPWLGMSVTQLVQLESVLLVGSTLRKEQPLLSARLRGAAKRGLKVSQLHVADDDLLMPVAHKSIVRPSALAASLAELTRGGDIAESLKGRRSAIVLGHYAQQHPDFAALLAQAHALGRATGATVCVLPQGANAVGAHLVGARPLRGGLDARAMLAQPRRAYVVAGLEAELDMGAEALAALGAAEFTIALTAYRNATAERAHVMLPIGTFAETAGTFVNMEGRVQSFNAAVKPQGQARPAWKVLRMLGAMLEAPGFHAETLPEVRAAIAPDLQAWARAGLGNELAAASGPAGEQPTAAQGLERIAEFGIYAADPVARRSRPLQKTADGRAARAVRLNPATAAGMGLASGEVVRVVQGGEARLPVALDAGTPQGCVRIARGVAETAALTAGEVTLEKIRGDGGGMSDLVLQLQSAAQGYANQWLGPEWGPQAFTAGRALVMIVMVLVPVLLTVLYYQLVERWVIGWIQVRKGPNRVGWKGVLQPIADAIKLLMKEQMVPAGANKALFLLAPVIAVAPALAAWAIVPFTPTWIIADVDAAILVMLAMTSMGIYGIIIAGWASNSKYAFLGAMRAAAQMVAYELAMGFALVGALMAGQSMRLSEIVARQDGNWGFIEWFWLPLFPLFLIHYIAGLAETNRHPFDVAEGESEIVAGFHVEYSGMMFAVFFLAEYANMILISVVSSLVFMGGWLSPFNFAFMREAGAPLSWLAAPGIWWLLAKVAFLMFVFLWVRASFPRYRYDQIMRLGWKVFIPITLIWIAVVGVMMMEPFASDYFPMWFGRQP